MAEIVNLNRARKARDREAEKAQAAANRVAFGRDKAARARDREESEKRAALLDGARREETPGPGKPSDG
ncbi:DUF4169 family protein [Acetobacteraceae bacterium H6797]|nr:DUF4169 family protein [Acetobacteraceae bacterium H6797]